MQTIKELIPAVLQSCQTPVKLKRHQLLNEWPAIAGSRLARHTKPSLTEEGCLFVWVDQPTLAFELSQKYRQGLLKRVQAVLGEDTVTSIRFRVGQLH